MRKKFIILVVVLILAMILLQSCTPQDQEAVSGFLEAITNILTAAWRLEGNSYILFEGGRNVAITIDLSDEPYPVNRASDKAFFTTQRIQERVVIADIEEFGFFCGSGNEGDMEGDFISLETTLVFWSENNWEGTKAVFNCGGSIDIGDYEVSANIPAMGSFCVVTEHTRTDRRARCLNGPRCDDGYLNGSETDVDCGGSCEQACGINDTCAVDSDCASDICRNYTCHAPTCSDGMQNQGETDEDCGGPCNDCPLGRTCNSANDCQSGYCTDHTCTIRPTCNGDLSTSSAGYFAVLVEDFRSCGGVATYYANSLSDAKGCAEAEGLTPVSTLCGYYLNSGDNWYPYVEASSESHAITCANYALCSNCSWVVVEITQCASQ